VFLHYLEFAAATGKSRTRTTTAQKASTSAASGSSKSSPADDATHIYENQIKPLKEKVDKMKKSLAQRLIGDENADLKQTKLDECSADIKAKFFGALERVKYWGKEAATEDQKEDVLTMSLEDFQSEIEGRREENNKSIKNAEAKIKSCSKKITASEKKIAEETKEKEKHEAEYKNTAKDDKAKKNEMKVAVRTSRKKLTDLLAEKAVFVTDSDKVEKSLNLLKDRASAYNLIKSLEKRNVG